MKTSEIDAVIRRLAKHYRFGYMDEEDMVQQGWVFALDILKRKPNLDEVYLDRHLRHRFIPIKFEWVKGGKT